MKIFADKNILDLESSFSSHGELHYFDGRSVKRADILEADALIVRSITSIDQALIDGTKVRFVGTATSGIDHVDTTYLRDAGIHFADAKGCNANAVVDYCFTALAFASLHKGFSLEESKVGIVGAGAVGGLFAERLEELGIGVRCCDPILEKEDNSERSYCSLDAVLECDVISLHVPLCHGGRYPTRDLVSAAQLDRMQGGAVLINACRGGVVNESEMKRFLMRREDVTTVFDVWANEPSIDASLAALVDIATPHIAGYSREAKSQATKVLAREFENYFKLPAVDNTVDCGVESVAISLEFNGDDSAVWRTLLSAFPLDQLSKQFKQALIDGEGKLAFDSYRKKLLGRQEFGSKLLPRKHYTLTQQTQLSILGFSLD